MRLGIPTSTPLAVQQWDGIIAVNYSARRCGVKRGDRAETALSKCPQIKLVHVETIGADSIAGEDEEEGASVAAGGAGAGPSKGACKVSLERYSIYSWHLLLCGFFDRRGLVHTGASLRGESAAAARYPSRGTPRGQFCCHAHVVLVTTREAAESDSSAPPFL